MSDRWVSRTWEGAASSEAYFVVCNDDEFRAKSLDSASRAAFFASGEAHVSAVFRTVERLIGGPFRPRRALDFGCGVGRLLLPIAARSEQAVGYDVSRAMLDEAGRNVDERKMSNVRLLQSTYSFTELTGRFDFVHSFITFQHIPPTVGEDIAKRLVASLDPGGVAALQFTYRRSAPVWRRSVHAVRRAIPQVNALAPLVSRRRRGEPFFPMYTYRLDRLFEIFRGAGCSAVHCELTRHGEHHGALLIAHR